MSEQKTIVLNELFTTAELDKALALYADCKKQGLRFHPQCTDKITKPAIDRINKATGQENDPEYWAYAIEWAIMKTGAERE